MKWTANAWQTITPVLNRIFDMPFIQELQAGTLALDKFQFYMLQDAKYLEHFGRVLAYLGSKCEDNTQALDFFEFGKNALIVEKALHETYFMQFGLVEQPSTAIEPVCHHYIHFLKSTAAFEPLEIAVAAVLPCFWIYQVVGDVIYSKQTDAANNPYAAWIATYSGDDFAKSVELAKNYVDEMAARTTADLRDRMLQAFVAASQLEFLFWDAAYDKKSWMPI
ncbi:thiaminase II [Sphingobacterium oryzagri]|uniref:Aminopyrimidine aminohydrolase n=1 Tax=Sphingobacterium oryzagri TaxID=3025669 RepID=A0ABY7WER7_9SPHI|nr:thiaminase II [Sphingobacterium sp. KACC 22765]WDF67380.1 thiaminase II [Sphingobacterium sp. KACC 22765]